MLKEKWLAAEAKEFTFIVGQSVGINNASISNYPHTRGKVVFDKHRKQKSGISYLAL